MLEDLASVSKRVGAIEWLPSKSYLKANNRARSTQLPGGIEPQTRGTLDVLTP